MQLGQRPRFSRRDTWRSQRWPCPRRCRRSTDGGAVRSILVTGGAGFIGSHLVDELTAEGYQVRVLDSLVGQVHGDGERPDYLHEDAELLVGDVRDGDAVRRALDGVDAVVHLAARVGVGQSMYEISEYVSANTLGTAVLLQELLDH